MTTAPERMQCMEVWGGNRETSRGLEMPGMSVRVVSRPFEQATSGGDVYYLSSCASGRITRLLLADVSGHGANVSQQARALCELMRRNVNIIRQSRLVDAMNGQFTDLARKGGFATAVVGTYFAPTRSLSVSSAGHPPPLLFRQQDATWTALQNPSAGDDPADLPLGVLAKSAYTLQKTRMAPGDMLLCYSDALIESRDSEDRLLGVEGLLAAVREQDPGHPDTLVAGLLDDLARRQPGNLTEDDVTVILLQATRSGVPWKDRLAAPFRLLGKARVRASFREHADAS